MSELKHNHVNQQPPRYIYTIKFWKTGHDHDNNEDCFDVEATDINEIEEYCTQKITRFCKADSLHEFDTVHYGCTSNGSSCCSGFDQYYKAMKVTEIIYFANDANDNQDLSDHMNELNFRLNDDISVDSDA